MVPNLCTPSQPAESLRFEQLLASVGSVTPPALLEAGFPKLDLVSGGFPPDTLQLELEVKRGVFLRGVHVPAANDPDGNAPVVVHLLESLGSITYGTQNLLGYPCLWSLSRAGFQSLVVDYRGIGASDGKRSPRNMPADAQCVLKEALKITRNNESKIILRALSLGTLAAAAICESSKLNFGAICMVAPVRAETVAGNWLSKYHGPLVKRFATLINMRRPVKVDIKKVIAKLKSPLFVYAPEVDYALPPDEMKLMRQACLQANGQWISSPYNHSGHVLSGHEIVAEELSFLHDIFPTDSSEISPPKLADLEQWQRLLDWTQLKRLPQEALAALWHLESNETYKLLIQLRLNSNINSQIKGIEQSSILKSHGIPVRQIGKSTQFYCLKQRNWVNLDGRS